MKRAKIISSITNEKYFYGVPEEIYETLDRLSFKDSSSQVPEWDIFTRQNPKEFVGIYGDKKYLIKGNYEDIETSKKDLETISKYVFNSGWISKKIRERSVAPIFFPPLALAGLTGYDMLNGKSDLLNDLNNYINSISNSNDEMAAVKVLLVGMAGAMCIIPSSILIAEKLLNKHYGSKLSKQAENYLYGKNAEDNLRKEYIFEKIQAGEIAKQDFLKLKEI